MEITKQITRLILAFAIFNIYIFAPAFSLAFISDKRLELQAQARGAVQNFNDWNAGRNVIMANKERILQHRIKMKQCLESLMVSFNEEFYLSCVVQNSDFDAILAWMPKDSVTLHFPDHDVTGNELKEKAQVLLSEFKKLISISQQTVKNFDDESKRLRIKDLNKKSDTIVTHLANEANRSFFCTPTMADLICKTVNPLKLRLLLAKMLGDFVDIQSLQLQIQNIANQLSNGVKYCGNMAEFTQAESRVKIVLKDASDALNLTPREAHLSAFCKDADAYKDSDALTLCQTYCSKTSCAGPLPAEVFYSVNAAMKRVTSQRGVK